MDSTGSSGSDCSSPRGPKGGGTLKTCAVCIEDYRSASALQAHPYSVHSNVEQSGSVIHVMPPGQFHPTCAYVQVQVQLLLGDLWLPRQGCVIVRPPGGVYMDAAGVQGRGEAAGAALQAQVPPGVHRPVAVQPEAAVPHLQVGRPAAVWQHA